MLDGSGLDICCAILRISWLVLVHTLCLAPAPVLHYASKKPLTEAPQIHGFPYGPPRPGDAKVSRSTLDMPRPTYKVLIADDSSDDAVLLKRAFKDAEAAKLMDTLTTGQQVIEYFEGKGRYRDRQVHPIPDVLILDLRMPIKSGFEVLEHLRAHGLPSPKRVVILTSVARPADIQKAHDLGAHFIACKEADLRSLVQRLDRVMQEDLPGSGPGQDRPQLSPEPMSGPTLDGKARHPSD
jgi:CheY-like chemotaxis protein